MKTSPATTVAATNSPGLTPPPEAIRKAGAQTATNAAPASSAPVSTAKPISTVTASRSAWLRCSMPEVSQVRTRADKPATPRARPLGIR